MLLDINSWLARLGDRLCKDMDSFNAYDNTFFSGEVIPNASFSGNNVSVFLSSCQSSPVFGVSNNKDRYTDILGKKSLKPYLNISHLILKLL